MPSPSVSKTALEHLALVLSLTGGAAVALRVLGAASLDPDTALIILQSQGTSAVIFGTLMPILGVLPAAFGVLMVSALIPRGRLMSPWGAFSIIVFVTGALAVPPGLLILLVAPVAFNVVAGLIIRPIIKPVRSPEGEARRRTASVAVGSGCVSVGTLMLLVTAAPWIPAESISTSHRASFTGYVLDESDDELTILQYEPRIVVRLSAKDAEREFCRVAYEDSSKLSAFARAGKPLVFYLTNSPEAERYDACPIED